MAPRDAMIAFAKYVLQDSYLPAEFPEPQVITATDEPVRGLSLKIAVNGKEILLIYVEGVQGSVFPEDNLPIKIQISLDDIDIPFETSQSPALIQEQIRKYFKVNFKSNTDDFFPPYSSFRYGTNVGNATLEWVWRNKDGTMEGISTQRFAGGTSARGPISSNRHQIAIVFKNSPLYAKNTTLGLTRDLRSNPVDQSTTGGPTSGNASNNSQPAGTAGGSSPPTAVLRPAYSLSLVERLPIGSLQSSIPSSIVYRFRVVGMDGPLQPFLTPSIPGVGPNGEVRSWNRSQAQGTFDIPFPPGVPAGHYQITVTAPDGTRVTAGFDHTP